MNVEEFREYCLSKPNVTEDFPFGPEVMTFKIGEKMFALTNLYSDVFAVNLKCDPDYAVELRENHEEILEGYHMDKRHWIFVNFEGGLKEGMLKELIDSSYNLVVESLPKSVRNELFGF